MDTLSRTLSTTVFSFACAVGCISTASGTIVYDTPGTYVINTIVNDNVLTDHRDVNIVVDSGGVIRGVETPSTAFPGAIRTRLGNLDVIGNGRIIAAPNQSAISMAGGGWTVRLRDQASVTGDLTSPVSIPGYQDESTARGRLYIQDQAVVNGNLLYANFVRIQDQALIRGDVQASFNASMTLDMRGGTVAGALRLGGLDDHRFTMSGGSILGGFRGNPSYVEMTMTGGFIDQGFRTVGNIDGEIRGGQIDGGISLLPNSIGASELAISGGIFDTYDGQWLLAFSDTRQFGGTFALSTLDISGGQFGYGNAGLGFFIDEYVNFNIWGRDLVYSGGWLSGYLQDGSWFHNALTFGDNWHGTFTVHNVPEPGSLALLLVGLIGLAARRRRSV